MSSQKSEVLNVLFHFRNRLDVPSPPSPSLHFRREIRPCIRVLPRSYTRAPCGSTRRSPTFLRIHAQLPLLILIETEQPRRIHMHYLFHCPPHKPQQHFVTIVAVLPRRDNFPEAGPSIPWLHFTSRGQCLRLHLITRRPAMFMFVALPVLFIFLE